MSGNRNDCDAVSLVVGLVVFGLPLTLLVPGFSLTNVLPKVRISRLHIVDQSVTWTQLNASLITLLVLFFCIYLELRKRKIGLNLTTISKVISKVMMWSKLERGCREDAYSVCDLDLGSGMLYLYSRLDEMVENVLTVSKATDAAMEVERERQGAEVRACVRLLDASAEHYETLILLKDDLKQRDKSIIQHPPVIEPSASEF